MESAPPELISSISLSSRLGRENFSGLSHHSKTVGWEGIELRRVEGWPAKEVTRVSSVVAGNPLRNLIRGTWGGTLASFDKSRRLL